MPLRVLLSLSQFCSVKERIPQEKPFLLKLLGENQLKKGVRVVRGDLALHRSRF